jgi:hypothetical protein
MYPSKHTPLLYQMTVVEQRYRDVSTLRHFCDLVPAKLLLALCARVAPEDGRPRPSWVVQIEERVMSLTDAEGCGA